VNTVPRVALTLEQCWHRVPGGTAVSILGAASALAARDDVDVIGVSAFHRRAAPAAWTPPVPVRGLPLPRRLLYETWHYARRPAVERATGPVDVVHATTLAIPPRSAPLVVTIHDLAFVHDPSHFTRHGLRFFHRGLDLARRDADLVTVPSDETRRDCLAHGFADERVRVVPWATDAEAVDDDEVARVRSTYGLDRPFVLWVGTIEPRKNLPTLLAAFDTLDRPDIDLVLVGPDGWNEELSRLQAGRSHPARALGFVPRADLHALYAAAAVFCYPSRREGFGLPVLEAMAQGTAVVTSAGTSTAEVAGDAGLLVEPTDRSSLADALARLLDDPAEAAQLGRAGQVRAAGYRWPTVAEQLTGLYREVSA
jgi:glycosyltransferase involved in cell wall biosynthesis